MEKIFQSFVLDESAKESETLAAYLQKQSPNAGQTLIEEMKKKGYEVLVSDKVCFGLPEIIMIGADVNGNNLKHKSDFYELTGRLGVPYISGDCFFSQ